MKTKPVLIYTLFGLVLSSVLPVAVHAANLPSLTGSWQLTLTPVTPIASVLVPVQGLATFTSDGSIVETDTSEVVPTMNATGAVVFGTPGHGIWQPGPAIGTLFIQFINLSVNRNGTIHAKKTVTITGMLDSTGNHFTGSYSYELVDPAGHVIGNGSGNVAADKIPHPLLP